MGDGRVREVVVDMRALADAGLVEVASRIPFCFETRSLEPAASPTLQSVLFDAVEMSCLRGDGDRDEFLGCHVVSVLSELGEPLGTES